VPSEPTLGEYLLGVAGLALLRLAFTEDEAGRAARVADVRELVARVGTDTTFDALVGTEYDLEEGYRQWSATYDRPLRLFPIEEPPMHALIDALPPGTALDAACGSGRYSAHLATRGHEVIGVDRSEAMLDLAREKVPDATFRSGDLTALPVPDRTFETVVCALALVHLPQVAAAMDEFARVLRPGGRLIVSDVHPFLVGLAWQAQFPAAGGGRGFMRLHQHLHSEYLAAATAAGLTFRSLDEPMLSAASVVTAAAEIVPDANREAYAGLPALTIWGFERR
jgi:SAM-dependent methyltransferase